jgi:stage IV sporulation protein FB
MKKISFYVEPFAPAGIFLILFSWDPYARVAVITSVIVHELAHLAAMKMYRGRVENVRVTAFGISFGFSAPKTYAEEAFVCAAGPAASFLYAYIGSVRGGEFGAQVFLFSFFLGAINLIPIESFDGGRIIKSAVSAVFGISAAETVSSVLSLSALLLIWLAAVYVLFYSGTNFALMLFAAYIFAFTVIKKDCNFSDKMLQ